ncbi:putative U3 small nucleolar RNA-associated protein 18-like [Apostichopus japonicus]|uniref:U3 small nucleolar RNA-associated protein 18 homolog n=1 Tax=Stichopus japonicus TaxID=307972 RepID=A0A2G8KNV4_STIJA|nr:putative U3 small nucleolar RNA-associated protein 18-like [Apostichopus japonicus]
MLRKNNNFVVDAGTQLSPKKKRKSAPSQEALGLPQRKDEEESYLESKVFGGENLLLDTLLEKRLTSQHTEVKDSEIIKEGLLEEERPKPVWQDEDDSNSERNTIENKQDSDREKARQLQFERALGPRPLWALLKSERLQEQSDSDDESEEETFIPLTRRTGTYLTSSASLPKGHLDFQICNDANISRRNKKFVSSVEFHKTAQVILVAGYDQTLSLFQVDGKQNAAIQSIFLENFPIYSAHFSADGNEVIMSSEFKWFYSFDMMTGKVHKIPQIKGVPERSFPLFRVSPDGKLLAFRGKCGNIYLVSAKSKEYISTFKGNGRMMDLCFSSDGSRLFSVGDECKVYVWDVNNRRCVHMFEDDGCTLGTSISASDNGQYIAVGSDSGIVNLYDQGCFEKTRPTPLKIIKNLTTNVTATKFAPSNEILGIASRLESNAVKMIHLPSYEAFPNFGDSKLNFVRCATAIDFSPNSGYLCLGSSKERALLFRLKHYSSY